MKDKVLCIFSPAFPDEKDPFWLPPVQVFIRALNRNFRGIKLVIFSFQYPHNNTSYIWEGNTAIPFNGMHKGKTARLWMWMKIIKRFFGLSKKYEAVGILSLWCGECAFVAKYCAALFSVKHYCWILGQDARATNNYIKRIVPKPEMLIALSDFVQAEFYRNHGIRPARVITKGIDPAMFEKSHQAKDIDIIGVGSLSFLKRYTVFVTVISALQKQIPGIKAMLCGDGEDMQNIRSLVQSLQLEHHIQLTGTLQQPEAIKAMQRSRILLHPSSYEGFGIVCLEALYAGAHVISFCKPMNRNIRNWHIVETEEQMFEEALNILQNPQQDYAPQLIYHIDDSAKEIMALFQ